MVNKTNNCPNCGYELAPPVHLSLWERIVGFFYLIFGFGRR